MYLAGTLYRIHGSNEPDSIGHAVSSGCIRMTNQDVIDLYERARVGARVVVTRWAIHHREPRKAAFSRQKVFPIELPGRAQVYARE
jgi:hypothetical protein